MKEGSYATYRTLLHKHLLPSFGDCTRITEAALQDFVLEKLDYGYRLSSVQLMVIVVRMILRHGASKGLCEAPHWSVRYPSGHANRPLRLFSRQEQRTICRHIKENPSARGLGIVIALSTGMRIGELCALRWKDIDLESGVVHVRGTVSRIYRPNADGARTVLLEGSPKTPSSVRDIPLADHLSALLLSLSHGRSGADFVLTAGPRPTEPRAYRNYYNALQDALGMQRRTFHALRHTFATRCIENGFDAKTVSELLGHSSIKTTLDLYVHPGWDKKKACVNSISQEL